MVSFTAQTLRSALGVPSTKLPIDGIVLVSYVLPPIICYFVAAVLAITPRTRTIRVATWPLIASLSLRAVLSVDMSLGKAELGFLNIALALFMLCFTAHTLDWALAKGPLVRHLRPAKSSSSIIMDALDLASNVRGHGWDWSCYRSYIPRETRPSGRLAFVSHTVLSALAHYLICGAMHRTALSLAGAGPMPGGSTLFDDTLPLIVRCLRAATTSTLTVLSIYAGIQANYDLSTASAILLGQDPVQWPPMFDAPWCATSIADFWGHRWHQLLRNVFLVFGGRPLAAVLGRTGTILGAFLASGALHHVAMVAIGSSIEPWWMLVGFGMMGPGVLAERAFYRWTGRRVGGVAGWVWTMAWLLTWGTMIVEGFTRAGLLGSSSFVDDALPVRIPLERLAVGLDAWLHTAYNA